MNDQHPLLILLILFFACNNQQAPENSPPATTSIVILGTIQDAGSPHIGCKKDCCKNLFTHPDPNRQVVALGLFDREQNKKYLFEATPDIARQLKSLKYFGTESAEEMPAGIFLTHAHIGHYAGLMYLGKEATDARNVPVFAMPRMKQYLETNGPWSQLVANQNMLISPIENEQTVALSATLQVTPVLVPHRDEYSETVGYVIKGPNKSALFIPDIDKWEKWDKHIIDEIQKVDYAFLDATFYSGEELGNRDISQIPHPFIIESVQKFADLSEAEKSKIIFIHFNHTNPVIDPASAEAREVISKGFRIGRINEIFDL